MVHDTQSAQNAQSKEHNTYTVTQIMHVEYVEHSVWHESISVLINIFSAPSLVLAEHSVGSNTNNA